MRHDPNLVIQSKDWGSSQRWWAPDTWWDSNHETFLVAGLGAIAIPGCALADEFPRLVVVKLHTKASNMLVTSCSEQRNLCPWQGHRHLWHLIVDTLHKA